VKEKIQEKGPGLKRRRKKKYQEKKKGGGKKAKLLAVPNRIRPGRKRKGEKKKNKEKERCLICRIIKMGKKGDQKNRTFLNGKVWIGVRERGGGRKKKRGK